MRMKFWIVVGLLGHNLYVYCFNNPVNWEDSCGHRPGQLFNSINGAIKDFANIYNKKSINRNKEYATFIYKEKKNGKTYYSYYIPWKGTSTAVSIKVPVNIHRKNYNIVATAHTHAAYVRKTDENFSKDDKDIGKDLRLNMYLVTPKGRIKKYNYKTGKVTTWEYRTHHDRKAFGSTHICFKCSFWRIW